MRGISLLIRVLPIGLVGLLLTVLLVLALVRVTRTVESPGEIRVHHYDVVRPEVPGIVTEVRVEPGDTVYAGQVLFELRDFDFERQVLEVKQRLHDARTKRLALESRHRQLDIEIHPLEKTRQTQTVAESRLAELTSASRTRELELKLKRTEESHRRMQGLHEAGLISAQALTESKYDQLEAGERYQQSILEEQLTKARRQDAGDATDLLAAEHRRAMAEISAEQAQLDFLIDQLTAELERLDEIHTQHTLRAEIDGVMVSETANDLRGRRAIQGDELGSIIDPESVYFVTYVPEAAILKVRPGQEAFVELAGLPKRSFDVFGGEVSKVADHPNMMETATEALYPVEIRLSRPWVIWEEQRFYVRSGMRGQAKISYRADVSLLRAIYESLVGDPGLSSDDSPELRTVEIDGRSRHQFALGT